MNLKETRAINDSKADTAEITTEEQMKLAVAAAEDSKAESLTVLQLGSISDFTDLFLICSGSNQRQVQAIAENILDSLRNNGFKPLHVEGQQRGRWILMDYGNDMVIHVFHAEARGFYDLERLWSDAPDVTQSFTTASPSA